MRTNNNTDNPFCHNYVFTKLDLMRKRPMLDWWDKLMLSFKPTYVQINDGYVWYFKLLSGGRILLIKAVEKDWMTAPQT